MSASVGMMKFPTGKIKFMFQSTNQNMFGNGRNIKKHGGFVLFSYFGNGRVKCVSLEMVEFRFQTTESYLLLLFTQCTFAQRRPRTIPPRCIRHATWDDFFRVNQAGRRRQGIHCIYVIVQQWDPLSQIYQLLWI